VRVENTPCLVYTTAAIEAEKLRAICQQMESYPHRPHPTPRPRDFYDIHSICQATGLNLDGEQERSLVRSIFDAKLVPVALLPEIRNTYTFHVAAWESVRLSVRQPLQDFDHYFTFVADRAESLHRGWME